MSETIHPRVRVFLLTYRRPVLLARAIASLRAQTFTNWCCEVHNDDPADRGPSRLLESLRDARIQLFDHGQNWGAVRSFNHAYAGGSEEYGAILEDDNWWEPNFLEEMVAAISADAAVVLAWSNMRLWQENPDGSWRDTGNTIWNRTADTVVFDRPEPIQLSDALHSHGAMVFRAQASRTALVPMSTPLAIIEPVRERLLAGKMILLARPLANFAITQRTSRSADRVLWAQSQLIVAASFILANPPDSLELAEIWMVLRKQRPPSTSLLFHLALAGIARWQILRGAQLTDWIRFLAGAIRHPLILSRILRFRQDHLELWERLTATPISHHMEALPERTRPAVFAKNPS